MNSFFSFIILGKTSYNNPNAGTHEIKYEDSPILQFYKNSNVLITGATGFLGKVLVEKLLRSCNGIQSVNILIRSKKGLKVEERLKDFINNPVSLRSFGMYKRKKAQIYKRSIILYHGLLLLKRKQY